MIYIDSESESSLDGRAWLADTAQALQQPVWHPVGRFLSGLAVYPVERRHRPLLLFVRVPLSLGSFVERDDSSWCKPGFYEALAHAGKDFLHQHGLRHEKAFLDPIDYALRRLDARAGVVDVALVPDERVVASIELASGIEGSVSVRNV